jgi:hypothetical protein
MMTRHPDLFVFPETHWIPKLVEFFGHGDGDVAEMIGIVARTRFVDGASTLAHDLSSVPFEVSATGTLTVRHFCDQVGHFLAAREGKSYWADKTPDYGPYMAMIQGLWPECRFIHLIRDGYKCAVSMSHHPGYRWLASARELWWPPAAFNAYHTVVAVRECPPEAYLEMWARRLMRIRDEATRLRPGSYLELRFEELCERPQDVLRLIAAFVELDAPSRWLATAGAMIDPSRTGPRSWSRPVATPATVSSLLGELGYAPDVP